MLLEIQADASTPARNEAESSVAPIPYREENGGMAGTAGGAMLVAILLLAAFAVAVRFARRSGLLARWGFDAPNGKATERPEMRIESMLRVGRKTMVYRIRDGRRSYLLVESSVQAELIHVEDEVDPIPHVQVADREDHAGQR